MEVYSCSAKSGKIVKVKIDSSCFPELLLMFIIVIDHIVIALKCCCRHHHCHHYHFYHHHFISGRLTLLSISGLSLELVTEICIPSWLCTSVLCTFTGNCMFSLFSSFQINKSQMCVDLQSHGMR